MSEDTKKPVGGYSRRSVLKKAATVAAAGAVAPYVVTGFPAVHASDPVTLRIAGTGVNAFNELAQKAKEDLGFNIQYITLTSDDVVRRAVTQPTSFDMLDSEYWMLAKIVPSGNMLGMDAKRIKAYDDIVPIFTKGELPNGKQMSRQGTAPIKVAYRSEDVV